MGSISAFNLSGDEVVTTTSCVGIASLIYADSLQSGKGSKGGKQERNEV